MHKDNLHSLIQDTLRYAQDPAFNHPSFFCTTPPDPIKTAPTPISTPVAKTKPLPDIQAALKTLAPALKLTETIPDDTEGKIKAMLWKEKIADAQVVLLALSTDETTLELLKSLGKAIDTRLAKAKIIPGERLEKEKQWPHFFSANTFRLIIASSPSNHYPELLKQNRPILFLEEASFYKHIEKKAELWKTICDRLRPS